MTARISAARAAVHAVVKMYQPLHQSFTEEGTQRLNAALKEVEEAAVDAYKATLPVPAIEVKTPEPVKFNEPKHESAATPPEAPNEAKLPPPPAPSADTQPGAGKSKGKGKNAT